MAGVELGQEAKVPLPTPSYWNLGRVCGCSDPQYLNYTVGRAQLARDPHRMGILSYTHNCVVSYSSSLRSKNRYETG